MSREPDAGERGHGHDLGFDDESGLGLREPLIAYLLEDAGLGVMVLNARPVKTLHLRDLTRAQTAITRERGREVQRLEKLSEDAGNTLSSVASDVNGGSGRLMLQAMFDGQQGPAVLAISPDGGCVRRSPPPTEAVTGRFTDHHAFPARVHLDLIDRHTEAIHEITARIEGVIKPFEGLRDLIPTIPGIGPADR